MNYCVSCEIPRDQSKGQWWHLKGYYGFTGNFCSNCYDKISHNSYGQPNNPKEYTYMLLKRNS